MAMPLDPDTGLFPDTLVEPFIRSDVLAELGREVIASFDEFRPIELAMEEADLGIVWVFETKPFDPAAEEFKPHTIAKVTKASPLWRCLAGTPLVIQFRQTFWDAFDDQKRRAVIHHELTHIEVAEPDDQGRAKISLRPHDVEDFSLTMRRFGPIIPGRATFVKAFLDWQHEQERPEPTPLRPVGERVEDLMDRVMDEVVDQVNAGSLDDAAKGTTVRASRGKKPTTDVVCQEDGCVRWAGHEGAHDDGRDD